MTQAERHRKWYLKNREKVLARNKTPEAKERRRLYKKTDKFKLARKNRKSFRDYQRWYQNKPEVKAKRRKWYIDNKDKVRAYRKAHPANWHTYHIKNGYWYYNNERLQRRIYKRYVDPNLPDNWDVHHIDHNRQNNSLGNLKAMPHWLHSKLHQQGLI